MTLSLIHISEPTRQAEISYAVFCLKKKNILANHGAEHVKALTVSDVDRFTQQFCAPVGLSLIHI